MLLEATGRDWSFVEPDRRPARRRPRPALLGRLLARSPPSATRRRCRSRTGWRRPCSGTATTATGGSRCASGPRSDALARHRGRRAARQPRSSRCCPATTSSGSARAELDITSAAAVDRGGREVRPDVVINAAAYTAVDAAETDEADGAGWSTRQPSAHLARRGRAVGARLIHVSTDYVFDGDGDRPVRTRRSDRTAHRLRTHEAGRRAGCALADRRLRRPHGVGLRRPVGQLRRHDAATGGERPTVDVVDRPDRLADVRAPIWPARYRARCGRRVGAATAALRQRRPGVVVRAGPGGVPARPDTTRRGYAR